MHGSAAADWIAPRLTGEFGAVTRTVPSGYAAYARICHPAPDSDGGQVSWSAVAQATGRTPHALMQWHALVGSPDPLNMAGSLWHAGDPERGSLEPEALRALCNVLATTSPCCFCVWDGWGWAPASSGPRVSLPGRDYFLLTGALAGALQIGDSSSDGLGPQSPNLFWPTDAAWCVASEVDFDSTLVGGSAVLIEALLREPKLDAWQVQPDDSLAYDGDRLNSPYQ